MGNSTGLVDNNQTASAVNKTEGQSASAFAASLVTSIIIFAVEAGLFLLIKDRFTRIYQPRTYLVPERERTKAADPGLWKWIKPVLKTSNSEFVNKCGLDAYFFLRYLRTLIRIFVPAACIILPILLPLNSIGGRGSDWALDHPGSTNVTGLDQLAWGNVAPNHTGRYWAHFLLALGLIIWVCYISFDELRGYIRMRQAYLTSPQHRLRASATTVLVGSIPQKWNNIDALDGLFDVFPGGIRNIWINRNFDELGNKIKLRDKLASSLEGAETNLIKKCWKSNDQKHEKEAKQSGRKVTKDEKHQQDAVKNEQAIANARGHGLTSGNPHQIRHTVNEAVADASDSESAGDSENVGRSNGKGPALQIPIVGESLQKVTSGIGKFGRGVLGGFRRVEREVNDTMDTTNGYIPPPPDEAETASPGPTRDSGDRPDKTIQRKPAPSGPRGLHDNSDRMSKPKAKTPGLPAAQDQLHGKRVMEQNNDEQRVSHDSGMNLGRASRDNDQRALNAPSPNADDANPADDKTKSEVEPSKLTRIKTALGLAKEEKEPVEYPEAFIEEFLDDSEDAEWKHYIQEKDRDTMRLPIFPWMFSLPFLGEKVDTIYYCRKELAKLNSEIEEDQAHPERFPLMNSAFIQFNHQVAAHMACQSLSHHLPKQMAPRLVEIAPNDVIWDNMSLPWWQRYVRTAVVFVIVVAMILLWAIPVAFTSALSQLHYLADTVKWLHWILGAPSWFISLLQGVLPATFLGILMYLLPLILRFLVKQQGTQSGMLVELSVQRYYFFFLFVQLFIVVSIASAASTIISYFSDVSSIANVPNLLAENIPKASNYFFSYMLLQALSVSAGALVQVGGLISWFILAPLLDKTARNKFNRQTNLTNIQWGTFFPVYTNLAVIGLIYSVISPLILVFNIITFTLFWFVYRYNTLYVTKFTKDTGGLLYPNAINCTFVGLYTMELALIAMFFLIRDDNQNVACKGQAIGMIIILIITSGYQYLLHQAFAPLYTYLPITLEDDAVRRDEEFARAMNKEQGVLEDDEDNESLQHALEDRERRSREEDRQGEEFELQRIESEKQKKIKRSSWRNQLQNPEINMDIDGPNTIQRMTRKAVDKTADLTSNVLPTSSKKARHSSWADRDRNRRSANFGQYPSSTMSQSQSQDQLSHHRDSHREAPTALDVVNNFNPLIGKDLEAQRQARNELSDALFGGVHDELEDLTPDQRDALVQRAFQHSALRAKRPVIWLPRDNLGISDDEVRRMAAFSQNLWISNVRQGLDAKGRCVYSGAPPDFSEVDLIDL